MSSFDLLFLITVLATVTGVLRALHFLARRRPDSARRSAKRLAILLSAYGLVLVATSLVQPKRMLATGEARCFDEWCIAVDSARTLQSIGAERPVGTFVVVSVRILNHGGGRRQRESDVYGALADAGGHRYEPSERGRAALARGTGDTATLRDYVDAGAARPVRLVFDVPSSATALEFLTLHGRFPHAVIIGDPESFLHRPSVVVLNPTPAS